MGTTVLAHQGGWDEILWVALPVVLFVGLLWIANVRAARLDAPDDPSRDGTGADHRGDARVTIDEPDQRRHDGAEEPGPWR